MRRSSGRTGPPPTAISTPTAAPASAPTSSPGWPGRYRRGLGFEPEAVRVRSCEEHGNEAVGHLNLVGRADGRSHSYKEGAVARRGPDGWGVVLPRGFGGGHRPGR